MSLSKPKKIKLDKNPEPILEIYVDDNTYQDFEELIEEDEEDDSDLTDIRDWKLADIRATVENFKEEMSSSEAKRPMMSHSTIDRYLDSIFQTLDAEEIPKQMTIDDYIILDPPTDNEEYNNAIKDIEKQKRKRANSKIPIKCPVDPDCEVEDVLSTNMITHVRNHFKIKLYACGSDNCIYQSLTKRHMQDHIRNFHLDLKFECNECHAKFRTKLGQQLHQQNGHIIPSGKKIFVALGPGKIRRIRYKDEWIDVNYGVIRQLIVIPWINEAGEIVDWSIGFTAADNIQKVFGRLWRKVKRECEKDKMNEKWVDACGSAKEQLRKGYSMSPEKSFSLEIYGLGTMAISQLKWYARDYLNAVHILATREAQFFLQRYNDKLKEKLNAFLEDMPTRIRKHVEENGESFAM